jgi:cytidylate kinase
VPDLIIIAGPNGAGKTTFAKEYLSEGGVRFEFVNADEISRTLALEPGAQGHSDIRAGRVMLDRIDELVSARVDFVIETTLARVGIQIIHRGLKSRELSSASSNRRFRSRGTADENESTSEITTVLGKMSETLVDDVRKLVEPMFTLFDFMQFNVAVYDDIVRSFERGIIR